MRPAVLVLLVIVVCGCAKGQPLLAGGKPVSHWVQALDDPDPKVRKTAATKLGNVGTADAAALPALIKALKDKDANVRLEVILALVKFGPEARAACPALEEIQRNDANAQVRGYATRALEKLRSDP
jgi:HEAT repeat protein